jgi:AcrR family transcriptional regulator
MTTSTKDRILDAAELQFAENGYDGTSLRSITTAAEVNLAAVHYHFGSKVQLFQALFERRVGPINEERLARLQSLEDASAAGGPSLEAVLEVFFAPVVEHLGARDEGLRRFVQLAGRVNSTTGEHVDAIRDVFREVQEKFFPTFKQLLPAIDMDELFWRLHFAIGSMCTLMAAPDRLELISAGTCQSTDPQEALRQLVAFTAGGLSAASVKNQVPS